MATKTETLIKLHKQLGELTHHHAEATGGRKEVFAEEIERVKKQITDIQSGETTAAEAEDVSTDQHSRERKGIEKISKGGERMSVMLTLGFITEVRIDLGYYQAKVASLITPSHERSGHSMLGQEKNEKGKIIAPGTWMQFLYSADYLASHWIPQTGDRVMVLTFGSYDYTQARILPLTTSDKREAEAALELTINGRARILSGGPGLIV